MVRGKGTAACFLECQLARRILLVVCFSHFFPPLTKRRMATLARRERSEVKRPSDAVVGQGVRVPPPTQALCARGIETQHFLPPVNEFCPAARYDFQTVLGAVCALEREGRGGRRGG